MFNSFGPLEIILVLVIVLVIFGPKRLPMLGKQMGKGMREFKDSITGDSKDDDDEPGSSATLAAGPADERAPAAPPTPAPASVPEPVARPADVPPPPEPRP
jgi:sec-independent protein translocase protein TatA